MGTAIGVGHDIGATGAGRDIRATTAGHDIRATGASPDIGATGAGEGGWDCPAIGTAIGVGRDIEASRVSVGAGGRGGEGGGGRGRGKGSTGDSSSISDPNLGRSEQCHLFLSPSGICSRSCGRATLLLLG